MPPARTRAAARTRAGSGAGPCLHGGGARPRPRSDIRRSAGGRPPYPRWMPEALTDDGVTLHWEERGDPLGPLLVASMHFSATPAVFEGLWADLARDHRLVVYDPRGAGLSTRAGP